MNRTLKANNSALLIVDIQEAFRNVIPNFAKIVENTIACTKGFEIIGCPVFVSEQYPKGLGHTVDEIRNVANSASFFEKSTFSACGVKDIDKSLQEHGIENVVVLGVEAHVCVNQTVHGYLEAGFGVHLVEDAVGSRTDENRRIGVSKMIESGAIRSSTEMALFELLVDSKSPRFKEIQALVK